MNAQSQLTAADLNLNVPYFELIGTGSRDWMDRSAVWTPVTRLLKRHGRLLIRNGKNKRGADRHLSDWAARFDDSLVLEVPYLPDWDAYGNYAGNLRNQEMVSAGAQLVMAWANPCRKNGRWCPPGEHPSHGTADCVKRARAAGIHVVFSPEGMSW
jgi:hypothetical protein